LDAACHRGWQGQKDQPHLLAVPQCMGCAGCLGSCQGGEAKQVSEEVLSAHCSTRRNEWRNQDRRKAHWAEMSASGQRGERRKAESGASTRRKELQKLWLSNECWHQLQVLEATNERGETKQMMH